MPDIVLNHIARRTQNLKQNRIEIVKIQPSLQTLREGQEVLYQPKNKSLRRYRREGNILWSNDMTRDGNQYVDKDLKVSNDLTVDGVIYGNQLYIFTHSFDMDFTTSKVYLPWNATTENTAIATGFYDQLIAPYSGRLIKVMARPETASDSTVIGFHKSSDGTPDPSGTATESITVDIDCEDETFEFAFTGAASFSKGDTVALSFNPTTDPNHTKISSVWLFKITI